MEPIVITERLALRKMVQDDFEDLREMLQDPDVMYAWGHTFSVEQAQGWLDRQIERYEKSGVGLWAAVEKETSEMVGQVGLILGDIESKQVLELAYMLKKAYWHKGFAIESSRACLRYAFEEMRIDKVYATVRPENEASMKVVEKLGFMVCGEFVKNYDGKEMPHLIYVVDRGFRVKHGTTD